MDRMNQDLTEDQLLLRDTTRAFLEAKSPVGNLRSLEHEEMALDRDWWRLGAELGWTSMLIPESCGGGTVSGSGVLDLMLIAEEMGRVVAPGALTPTNVVAAVLARTRDESHNDLLRAIAAGDWVVSWALFEQVQHHETNQLSMHARREGSRYVLNGRKVMVEAARSADMLLVAAGPATAPTQFLVPTSARGVTIEGFTGLDLGRRHASVTFCEVAADPTALVGIEGSARPDIAYGMRLGALLQVAELCGVAGRVFDLTIDYMANRYTFGRPLSSYQALKHRAADMKMWLEACRGVAAAAALAVQEDRPDSGQKVSAAKCYVSEKATDLIQECVQLHGGIGVTWEHDLHLYLRRATVNRFTYGTPDEHREWLALGTGI
jgi:alkylation response protein AidB-like acyl-CoA dehydrogenase